MTSCTFLLMTLFLVGCGANSTPPPPPPMPHPESGIIVMQGTNNSTVHMVTLTVNIN